MALVCAWVPAVVQAQIITIKDSAGKPHQVNTQRDCKVTNETCTVYSNKRCVNWHRTWDCKVKKPAICSKWSTKTTCGNFQLPNNPNGLDFTKDFANALSGVAGGADVSKIFVSKPDSCTRDLICNECKGQPDPGVQKIIGATSMAFSIANYTMMIFEGAVTLGATSGALASMAQGVIAGMVDALGPAFGLVQSMAAIAPYIAIAAVLVSYLIAQSCRPTPLNGYAKWLGKSAHNLGTVCSSKVLGFCVQHRTWFCVYDNKFAYILAREIKKQLSKPWPAPGASTTASSCNNIYLNDLSRVDFSKMNLTDLFGDLKKSARNAKFDPGQVGNKIKNFYNKGKPVPGTAGKAAAPNATQSNAKAATYDQNIQNYMSSVGWQKGTPPPNGMSKVSGLGAICAETQQNQRNYIKNNLFAGKTLAQIRADVLAQFKKITPAPPVCNKKANPPQTMQKNYCYDPNVIKTATLDELATLFALALCDMKPM